MEDGQCLHTVEDAIVKYFPWGLGSGESHHTGAGIDLCGWKEPSSGLEGTSLPGSHPAARASLRHKGACRLEAVLLTPPTEGNPGSPASHCSRYVAEGGSRRAGRRRQPTAEAPTPPGPCAPPLVSRRRAPERSALSAAARCPVRSGTFGNFRRALAAIFSPLVWLAGCVARFLEAKLCPVRQWTGRYRDP